jgi:hypothetical protein
MVAATPRNRRSRIRSILGLTLALPIAAAVITLAACLPVAGGPAELRRLAGFDAEEIQKVLDAFHAD